MDLRKQIHHDLVINFCFCLSAVLFFIGIWGWRKFIEDIFRLSSELWIAPCILLGYVAHELIHAACFLCSRNTYARDLIFGFEWATLSPFVGSKQPIGMVLFRLSAIAPMLLLGVAPLLVSLTLGWSKVFVWSLLMLNSASSDFTLWRFTRNHSSDFDVYFSTNDTIEFIQRARTPPSP